MFFVIIYNQFSKVGGSSLNWTQTLISQWIGWQTFGWANNETYTNEERFGNVWNLFLIIPKRINRSKRL